MLHQQLLSDFGIGLCFCFEVMSEDRFGIDDDLTTAGQIDNHIWAFALGAGYLLSKDTVFAHPREFD